MEQPGSKTGVVLTITIFLLCLVLYTLTNYGGTRSPDSEMVFRVGEALESRGTFALERDLEKWRGFGLASGRNGRRYCIFGPGQSIAIVPLIKLAKLINTTSWYERSPVPINASHWYSNGIVEYLRRLKITDLEAHALRFIVSFFNPLISALGVVVFWKILRRMKVSTMSAWFTTLLYAFGTIVWPYSGTFFSEPLAVLFVLLSFYALMGFYTGTQRSSSALSASGLCLGIAAGTHITAVLFVPFFMAICISRPEKDDLRNRLKYLTWFTLGLAVPAALLAYHNYARFGSILETGRTVDPAFVTRFGYGRFAAPWIGLYGLLASGGKSIFLFCPAVVLGIIGWRYFHLKHRTLSLILIMMLIFRLLFIASRSDWHGGVCVGPRYLLMGVPFLSVPVAFWLDHLLAGGRKWQQWTLGMAGFICVAQQLYFCVGEIFSYYIILILMAPKRGIFLAHDYDIYTRWSFTPLTHLLSGKRGPCLLLNVPVSNVVLWLIVTLAVFVLLVWLSMWVWKREKQSPVSSPTMLR